MVGVDHLILSMPVSFPQWYVFNPFELDNLAVLDHARAVPAARQAERILTRSTILFPIAVAKPKWIGRSAENCFVS
jgi:hypothetical protein